MKIYQVGNVKATIKADKHKINSSKMRDRLMPSVNQKLPQSSKKKYQPSTETLVEIRNKETKGRNTNDQ